MHLKQLYYILILLLSVNCFAQSFYLNINGINKKQSLTIDSIPYAKKHVNIKSLNDELFSVTNKLSKQGYIDSKILETKKINDSTYTAFIDLKTKIKEVHVYIGINSFFNEYKKNTKDSIIIPFTELENFLNKEISNNEKAGFAFSKINLANIKKKNSIIYADLNLNSEKKRTLNSIIVNYTDLSLKDYFPKGALKQLNKKYTNRIFNQETVKRLYEDINSFEFVSQTKYPEILFTKDSTKVYTYIEKRKANTFDGYVGFSNDDSKKIRLNGYLDISLINILHAGEQFSLYWKSDGNKQTTFNTKLEIPYIFKSPLGIKAQLNIFKQDSTFQNTKTEINLGYFLNYNSKVYAGYQSTESSDIQNTNSATISDFKNSYFTTTLEHKKNDNSNYVFPRKSYANLLFGYGKRTTNNTTEIKETTNQFFANLNLSYNFELNKKNFIYINPQILYLKSDNYITNELFRFGGLNSIRGFSENSLQGNIANLFITEYRYLLSSNLYAHTILDYGIYQDRTSIKNSERFNSLISIGVSLGLLTKNGLLKIIIANGSTNEDKIKFYNSILTICYNVKF
ncbi:Surface antigen [Flavobacterium anhuiense]|uniref:Surface antigen n=1 Tax=Flavobacterium anhuiense TaxID=459526 RepID=A0AAC9D2I2_9FLAO|nr:Surface antigen [Flavobacterium anhuiense]